MPLVGENADCNDANTGLIAYLRNHAKEIINLVEAAEMAHRNADELREAWRTGAVTSCDGKSGIWSSNNVEVEVSLREALAALNKSKEGE
jgi:hypothetical protein